MPHLNTVKDSLEKIRPTCPKNLVKIYKIKTLYLTFTLFQSTCLHAMYSKVFILALISLFENSPVKVTFSAVHPVYTDCTARKSTKMSTLKNTHLLVQAK